VLENRHWYSIKNLFIQTIEANKPDFRKKEIIEARQNSLHFVVVEICGNRRDVFDRNLFRDEDCRRLIDIN
jgi:hypothetical protein